MIEGRGEFGPREVLWLLEWLPEGSALQASRAGGPEHRPWTVPNILTAGILNGVAAGNWQRGGGKGKRPEMVEPPKPKPARRVAGRPTTPADGARRGMHATAARIARMRAVSAGNAPDTDPAAPDVSS